jgi:two-component system sensor histidine kinase HydH
MTANGSSKWRMLALVVIALATLSFHYGFLLPSSHHHGGVLHAIHGRLCYIPIILGAIWFGLRGGVATALAIALLSLPYSRFKGVTDRDVLLGEYTEMAFYLAIGLVAGILIEQQRRERKKSEALAAELAVKERLSSLGHMAAGLAHEIKNPLGSIQGAAEILADDAPPGTRKRDLLEVLKTETKRLNSVVEDFLRFARPRPPKLARASLERVLDGVISQLALESRGKEIEITRKCALDLPPVSVDPEQMHQVFLNIIQNSITADGTRRVEVALARGEGADRGAIAVTVRDDGEGIAPDILPRVFDPFFTTRDSGTGLGLAISHQIVREHGGRITVRSERRRGTEVTVFLPVRKE